MTSTKIFTPRAGAAFTLCNSAQMKTRFREFRQIRNLTLEKVGALIGMSSANLSKMERGEIPYNQSTLETLAALYGCKVTDLLDDSPMETAEEKLLLLKFRSLKQKDRESLLRIIDVLPEDSSPSSRPYYGMSEPPGPSFIGHPRQR